MRHLGWALVGALAVGCQHTSWPPPARDGEPAVVGTQTLIRPNVRWQEPLPQPTTLTLPTGMIPAYRLTRSHVTLRWGPGTQFAIDPEFLEYGTQVVVVDELKVWRKIVTLDTSRLGWVHQQQLRRDPKAQALVVPAQALKVVQARRAIGTLERYEDEAPLAVEIPPASVFLRLQWQKQRSLVWLPQANSVAWIANDLLL